VIAYAGVTSPAPPSDGRSGSDLTNSHAAAGQAELALRETGTPSLLVALDYLEPLADVRPDKFDRAAVRWHGRLELEAAVLTIAESQLALAALGVLRAGDRSGGVILRRLLRQARPTVAQRGRGA
jgi:hypothetical protein